MKKLKPQAKEVYTLLTKKFMCEYDDVGSVGKRYARFDEIGTPFCVTVDSEHFDTGSVTLRYRDSTKQETVKIDELISHIEKYLNNKES